MDRVERIRAFLAGSPFAVAGASRDRSKYGNRVLRAYMEHGRQVFPVNPTETEVEGLAAWPDVLSIPQRVHGLSIVTPPAVTRTVVQQAIAAGIRRLWMQPGAEDAEAVRLAKEAGASVIWGGPCLLVEIGRLDRRG